MGLGEGAWEEGEKEERERLVRAAWGVVRTMSWFLEEAGAYCWGEVVASEGRLLRERLAAGLGEEVQTQAQKFGSWSKKATARASSVGPEDGPTFGSWSRKGGIVDAVRGGAHHAHSRSVSSSVPEDGPSKFGSGSKRGRAFNALRHANTLSTSSVATVIAPKIHLDFTTL